MCFASIGHFISEIAELFIQATSLHRIFMEAVSAFCMCLPGCLASGALARYLVAAALFPSLLMLLALLVLLSLSLTLAYTYP